MLNMTELEKVQVLYAHFTGKNFTEYLKSLPAGHSWYGEINDLFYLVQELLDHPEEEQE